MPIVDFLSQLCFRTTRIIFGCHVLFLNPLFRVSEKSVLGPVRKPWHPDTPSFLVHVLHIFLSNILAFFIALIALIVIDGSVLAFWLFLHFELGSSFIRMNTIIRVSNGTNLKSWYFCLHWKTLLWHLEDNMQDIGSFEVKTRPETRFVQFIFLPFHFWFHSDL